MKREGEAYWRIGLNWSSIVMCGGHCNGTWYVMERFNATSGRLGWGVGWDWWVCVGLVGMCGFGRYVWVWQGCLGLAGMFGR